MSFKKRCTISSSYEFQAHQQRSQRSCCFSQNALLLFEVLPDAPRFVAGAPRRSAMQRDPSPGWREACNSPSEGTRFRQSCQSRPVHPGVSDRNYGCCWCQSRTIGWWPFQVHHPAIGSLIADARLTSPAIDECSSPTASILWIRRRRKDSMGSHCLHLDMGVLSWFTSCQMERRKRSYLKKRCIYRGCSISSHNLRSWTRTSKLNRWITTVSTSTITLAS